ncbi:MAG: NAD(P)H-hydrate dehydratase [Candidatus Omnitrophica bacterium]|nr:NAD(P)H-hydrate dehydratase [Candidatus Omnitrophota bacterium]
MRKNKNASKKDFGHVLVLAGSPAMLGASALCGLAAMRAGAGLTTLGIPQSLNLTLQKKISSVLMTLPLPETQGKTFSVTACKTLFPIWQKYQAMAIGPGITLNPSTKKFAIKVIQEAPCPLVVDADALNALSENISVLKKTKAFRILTPHSGEFSRLTGLTLQKIEANREALARGFAKRWGCILVLKGQHTVVAFPDGKIYINRTGNAGMATAGSGDVLTGMIAALLAQGIMPFEAAKCGVWLHGMAADKAIRNRKKFSLLANDIIEHIGMKSC